MSASIRHARRTVLGAALLAGVVLATAPAAQAVPGQEFVKTPTDALTSLNSVGDFATTETGKAWAVGSGWSAAEIATWDGTAWQPEQIPQFYGGFSGAVALDDTNVWAVGTSYDANNDSRPEALHSDGTTWTRTAIPEVPEKIARLNDVAADGADNVWAVGSAGIDAVQRPNADSRPYVVRWDGSSWQEVAVPVPAGTRHASLASVAVRGQEVWVAGTAYLRLDNGEERYQALVERFDGTQWTIVPTAPEPGAPDFLRFANRIAIGAAGQVWLAGQADIDQLIQRWNGSAFERGPELPPELRTPTSRGGALSVDDTGKAWVSSARSDSGGGGHRPLFGVWDGDSWNDVPVADPSLAGNGGVITTSRSGGVIWAFVTSFTSGPPVILRAEG
ncbi:hypothetical protein [Amycolatopsis pittospori]|uniref:hypothetical protein n=1 Tax=Amycolatopsis pittospori TaxID=2749434 RepID=UPI0015F015B2|nr:hypothetical protein [Amycolatopsis pittospori]